MGTAVPKGRIRANARGKARAELDLLSYFLHILFPAGPIPPGPREHGPRKPENLAPRPARAEGYEKFRLDGMLLFYAWEGAGKGSAFLLDERD